MTDRRLRIAMAGAAAATMVAALLGIGMRATYGGHAAVDEPQPKRRRRWPWFTIGLLVVPRTICACSALIRPSVSGRSPIHEYAVSAARV